MFWGGLRDMLWGVLWLCWKALRELLKHVVEEMLIIMITKSKKRIKASRSLIRGIKPYDL